MEFANLDLAPRATAALDQLTAMVDDGTVDLADAIVMARALVRIDQDPTAELATWLTLPGASQPESELAERVEANQLVFVIVWEPRPGRPAYIHDIGWEWRQP